ncbi:MAG: lantibiotic dehydratase, partial [Myxococcota bacterium]
DEARDFLDEVVDSQILVSQLTPAVTGREPIHGIIDCLRPCAEAAEVVAALTGVVAELAEIDRGGIGAQPARYRAIAGRLGALRLPVSPAGERPDAGGDEREPDGASSPDPSAATSVPVELSRLFQSDMVIASAGAGLSLGRAVVAHLDRAIAVLHRISEAPSSDVFERFRREFGQRYDSREVPLLEVLDEEAGIGFEASNAPTAEASPLLAGLAFPAAPGAESRSWRPRHDFLLRRIGECERADSAELVLGEDDIETLANEQPRPLPDALAVMAVVTADSDDDLAAGRVQVLIESAGGPSGARVLGRFCHASDELHAAVREHLRAEEALTPRAVFAEIVHLNQGRIGNVLCRPVLREYEIPFLGLSGAARDKQLPLDDLLVSVSGERIILRSRRLGRRVIPRMSTAHNYSGNHIGAYRFLCYLQNQGLSGLSWHWGPLDRLPFLPRVSYRQLVFARARWRLVGGELAPLAAASKLPKRGGDVARVRLRTYRAVQELREHRALPRFVVLADADNELPIDLDNPLSCDTFAHLVRSRRQAILLEPFPAADKLMARGPGGRVVSQIVVPFTRRPERERTAPAEVSPADAPRTEEAREKAPAARRAAVPRRFTPGSSWLYAKLYCGSSTADEVVRQAIAPLSRQLLAEGIADSWFFIRYSDPDWHVRVRWRGAPESLTATALPALHRAIDPLVAAGQVWRMQLDTYERETERYGGERGIELAEQYFWIDSEAVTAILDHLRGDEGSDARWRLTLFGADRLLDDLGLTLDEKWSLMRNAQRSFS